MTNEVDSGGSDRHEAQRGDQGAQRLTAFSAMPLIPAFLPFNSKSAAVPPPMNIPPHKAFHKSAVIATSRRYYITPAYAGYAVMPPFWPSKSATPRERFFARYIAVSAFLINSWPPEP